MATKKTRIYMDLTTHEKNKILETFELTDLIDIYLNSSRLQQLFYKLKKVKEEQYALTMPNANQKRPDTFYKSFEDFHKQFSTYLANVFVSLAIKEFAKYGDIARATKSIHTKAPEVFTQRLALAYEEIRSDLVIEKILNGQQPTEWLD